ncbi:MAG: ROK family transcriptional regulator [Pseudomonadota bacterium]
MRTAPGRAKATYGTATGERIARERSVLETLARHGPMSRADLARALGVMRSTTGTLVSRLLDQGMVRIAGQAAMVATSRSVGRPGELLTINPDDQHCIGAEVGVGCFRVIRTDLAGDIREVREHPMAVSAQRPQAVANALVDLIDAAAAAAPRIGGVAIAMPGIVSKGGHVIRLPTLDWQDIPLRSLIADRLAKYGDLWLENDANAFAIGEVTRRQDPDVPVQLFLFLDAGLGGAIVIDGRLMSGQSGLAGEFGHMFLPEPRAGAGAVSKRAEDILGRHAVLARLKKRGMRVKDFEEFLLMHERRDMAAVTAAEDWLDALATLLSSLTSAFNPNEVVLGGAMATLAERELPRLLQGYKNNLLHGTPPAQLVFSQSGAHCVGLGCADICRTAIFRKSSSLM